MAYQDSLQYDNYAVVGLQSVSPSLDAAGRPRMRLVLRRENAAPMFGQIFTAFEALNCSFTAGAVNLTSGYFTPGFGAGVASHGHQPEGFATSVDQGVVLSRHLGGGGAITRVELFSQRLNIDVYSAVPYTATRVGSDWLVYG